MPKPAIPRKLAKWFDKLDLTYAVRNLSRYIVFNQRDFCNGFLVAEILSRKFPDIDIYQFYNGLAMEKRRDNWTRVIAFLQKKGKTFRQDEWQPVMHLAKGAALYFLKE